MKTKHFIYLSSLTTVVILLSVLPFLPGLYFDGVRSLAFLAQLTGAAGLLLIPTGIAWVAFCRIKGKSLNTLPFYVILVPCIALIAQLALSAPLTERSRQIAIHNSAEMIGDIETYRAEHGEYPVSLFGVWADYATGIIGMERYYYEKNGESYNLTFEQPLFLLDRIGTREFVMYNPRDEHAMTSHPAWRLSNPEELRGWYAAHDAGAPHWKSFLFD